MRKNVIRRHEMAFGFHALTRDWISATRFFPTTLSFSIGRYVRACPMTYLACVLCNFCSAEKGWSLQKRQAYSVEKSRDFCQDVDNRFGKHEGN